MRRVHFGWRAYGTTSTLYSAANMLDNIIAAGVCTGYPATSYLPPNPWTSPNDQAPPTERWIWWETRWMRPLTWGAEHDDVVVWHTTDPATADDSHGQVTASTPVGDDLGVFWAIESSRSDWPAAGYSNCQAWWSVLYSTG